jgi:DNA-directed RNA polymerase specialized sigma24 family protein
MPPRSAPPAVPHDDDRCARLYLACKPACVAFARRRLWATGRQNRHLCAFDAEEFYDAAWETYYQRGEYLEHHVDHVRRINALILSRLTDERRRSSATKRTPPGRVVDLDDADRPATTGSGRPGTRRRTEPGTTAATGGLDVVVDRDELRLLLAQVRSPADVSALIDHEVRGLTFEEIGDQEGITAEAARRRAERAKAQARAHEPRARGDHDDR